MYRHHRETNIHIALIYRINDVSTVNLNSIGISIHVFLVNVYEKDNPRLIKQAVTR